MDLTQQVKIKALELGAVEVGICSSLALPHNALAEILPGVRSVVCLLFPHSKTALSSPDIYLKQFDTLFCYNELARISQRLSRYLEAHGYPSVAIPAALPLDMSDDKMGMVGAIDWKRAAVESGLGSWGKSGLVINPRFGPRIRIGGIITTAKLKPDMKLDFSPCQNCQICLDSCPTGALLGEGKVDKKLCAERVFTHGLRAFTRLLVDIARVRNETKVKELIYSHQTRELWQALESGNYYYCWTCQSNCPAGISSTEQTLA